MINACRNFHLNPRHRAAQDLMYLGLNAWIQLRTVALLRSHLTNHLYFGIFNTYPGTFLAKIVTFSCICMTTCFPLWEVSLGHL